MKKVLKHQTPVKKKKKSGFKRILLKCLIWFTFVGLLAGFIGGWYIYSRYSQDLPDVRALKQYEPSTITKVYSNQDDLIAEFYIENRVVLPFANIPLRLKQATLAVEDSNFYYHFGIDPKAIFRAFITNIKAGHVVEGGSTITQQLSKTLFLTFQKRLERKIREAILAIRMELIFTKDEILEMYLNQIYYGHGSYGVEAAARTYFGKSVQDLTISECAIIASLPKAPNHYSPYRNFEKATQRRNHAIRRMAKLGFITEEEKLEAMAEQIELGGMQDKLNKAPYFVEYIRQFVLDNYGKNKLYRDGLKIYTTLDLQAQLNAQKAIKTGLRKADKRYGYRGAIARVNLSQSTQSLDEVFQEWNDTRTEGPYQSGELLKGLVTDVAKDGAEVYLGPVEGFIPLENMAWAREVNPKLDGKYTKINNARKALAPGDVIEVKLVQPRDDGTWLLELEQEPEVQAGLISMDPLTGQIQAMVGGYDFSQSQFNRATQAIRQPGSSFKPIIYLAGLNDGYTPASIIIDSPVIFKEKEDTFDKWKPVNFEKKFYGPTSIRTALTHSRNVVTIKLLQNIGVYKAIEMARRLGINSHLANNLSIALGSSGMTLFEIVSAYSVFANQGQHVEPMPIRYIQDRNSNLFYTANPKTEQVISPGLAYIITNLLESVVQHGTGKKVRVLNRPVAAKTGTTNNYIDAWFIGYTPELVTGVWVGKDQDEPLGRNETGARVALPIWLDYMQETLKDRPKKNFPVPEDVTFVKIDPKSGFATDSENPNSQFEVFLKDNLPEKETGYNSTRSENTF